MRINQQIVNQTLDLILPLFLYFFWDWDLHFIFLFSYFDSLTGAVLNLLKERKIADYKSLNQIKFGAKVIKYLGLTLIGILFFELAILQIYPDIDLWSSFIDFLLFKELGIPQIALIIPIIVLFNYQQYQLFFVKMRVYETMPLAYLQNRHLNGSLLYVVSGALIFGISTFFPSSPLLHLSLVVLFKAVIDFIFIPYLDKKFVNQFVNSHHDFKRQY
jgi:hypothetical protein